MAQFEHILPTVKNIQEAERKHIIAEAALSARIDAQVTASTDSDADYAAEVVDGRVDSWSSEHASLGASIRYGQLKLSLNQEILQDQVNSLAVAVLDILATISEKRENMTGGNQ